MCNQLVILFSLVLFFLVTARGQSAINISSVPVLDALPSQSQQLPDARTISGIIFTPQNELAAGVTIVARNASGQERTTRSDREGNFRLSVPDGPVTLRFEGPNIKPLERTVAAGERAENLQITIEYVVPPVSESVTITATVVEPNIERRNGTVYREGLFSRDDQIFDTLAAGINAGQHEGGGKSIEVRRFGYNTDHGGVGGGLKVVVDNVQQNQASQGHGQGYLGSLKSLTPELIADVDILNGPFSAEYGDFTGLGVVQIRTKETLPDRFTARIQGGSFDTFRGFFAYSPALTNADAFIAYEVSRTDGPFISPLRYKRDNITGNYTRRFSDKTAAGVKFNFGRNDYFSSGQIPIDEIFAGRLDRFGFIDSDTGGRVRQGTVGVYFRRELANGGSFKLDGFLTRSLFNLYSNFTFFLNDPEFGDEFQQPDSRLQEGANTQYIRPYKLFGQPALLTAGGNLAAFQTKVSLFPSIGRTPNRAQVTRSSLNECAPVDSAVPGLPDRINSSCFQVTSHRARVTNTAGYVQQTLDLFEGHLRLGGGLRFDYFRFDVEDLLRPQLSGVEGQGRLQPKANVAYTPSDRLPATFYFNYGRGISSQDARGVVRRPESPKVATTDFYQFGTSHNFNRFSLTTDLFLIDQSNQQVYLADDGSIEFAGASRAYGFEIKNSIRLTNYLAFNGGITRVMNAFFRDADPDTGERLDVDSAPHTVANAALTLTSLHGFAGSLRYRHTSNYRLDPLDAGIRAAGLDVVDLYVSKRLRRFIDLNLAIDNVFNKRYFETQNYFLSRIRPIVFDTAGNVVDDGGLRERIHATPGYPFTVTAGITLRFGGK